MTTGNHEMKPQSETAKEKGETTNADIPPHKAGRPPDAEGRIFPAEQIHQALVHGTYVKSEGTIQLVYPSYREIAEKYGVSKSAVARYSHEHDCLERRKLEKGKILDLKDDKMSHKVAEKLAVTHDDQTAMIDQFLRNFQKSLDEGKVRSNSVSDFNYMIRLRAFLNGNPNDGKHEEVENGMPTLESLQRRHQEMRDEWERATDEERDAMPDYLYGFDAAYRNRKRQKQNNNDEK